MAQAPMPANEAKRQARIRELCLTDSASDREFEHIVTLAAEYFQAPIALISILEGQRQWFKARVGIEEKETPRHDAFCGYAILGDDVLEVSDATQDERFKDNVRVVGEPGIRFYAGMPLITADGIGLGCLGVADCKPRPALSARDLAMLRGFAGLVMDHIAALRDRNYVDEATGLFNRLRFEEDVAQSLERREKLIVVAADMLRPRFIKDIVNAFGYPFYREVTLAMKNRLQSLLPHDCQLYKISAARFGFLLSSQMLEQEKDFFTPILKAFQVPVTCWGIPVQAEMGLGVLKLDSDAHENRDWLRLVVNAANEAQARGTGWTYFNPETDQAQQRAFALLAELSSAVHEKNQLRLEYQPIIDLRTGQCAAVEALLRWRHPILGTINPGEFIPLAEKTALIRPLSQWVLRRSVEQAGAWRKQGFKFKTSINVSAQDLGDSSYIDLMLQLLESHGVEPCNFKIEFTESALMEDAREVARTLQRAKDAGVTVAIDDFGTGYSNWVYIRELPATVIKIDQSFIKNLATSERDQRLTRSVLEMIKEMGCRAVAEGIETREALELLKLWGCDEGQGYFFAKPMSPETLTQWLQSHQPQTIAAKPQVGEA